jgi:hypothetical protein
MTAGAFHAQQFNSIILLDRMTSTSSYVGEVDSLTSNVDVIPVLPGDKSMASSHFDSLVKTVTAHGQAQSNRAQLLLSCVNDLADDILRDDDMEEGPSLIEYEPTFKPNVKLQSDWTNKNYVSSNIIPIPMTHNIRPTNPDEDDDMVQRAKYNDVKMYVLVVGGILEQMKRDKSTNGVVHPMSEKSLLNILRTSQTKYEEIDCSLRTAQNGEQDDSSSNFSDSIWEVFYIEEDTTIEG